MADWVLIPCLKQLFAEFDQIAPSRDHASDGAVGDSSHAANVSDHNPDETGNVPEHDSDHVNEVHAIDVDNNLRSDEFDMEDVVQFMLSECRKEVGTDRGRLKYIIYYRRIWKASNGWRQETYTGPSPHTEHAHFSAEYISSMEADTRTWGLVERFGDMAIDQTDINKIADAVEAKIFGHKTTDYADPKTPQRQLTFDTWTGYSEGRGQVSKVYDAVNAGTAKILAAVGSVDVDESAIAASVVQGVLAGLSQADGAAEKIADMVIAALPPDLANQVVDEMASRLAAGDAQG
jgi:hypothetical protein